MTRNIPGIHHVTAISGAPQPNVDFYTGPLGQRLVKKTVNFDAPDLSLYYGDRIGSPGTILTFFLFVAAGRGRAGPGMASAVAYAVPQGGLEAWMMWLAEEGIDFEGPRERLGQQIITLADPDGMLVELIETECADAPNGTASARGDLPTGKPRDDGFHSVTLWLSDLVPTARVLTDLFGYEAAGQETGDGIERLRFRSPSRGRGSVVDLVRPDARSIGRQGAGTNLYRSKSSRFQIGPNGGAGTCQALQPSTLAECRKINSGRRIPSRRAIAGAKLQCDVLVAIRNPQWRPGHRIWLGGNRRSGIGRSFAFRDLFVGPAD